MQVKGSLQGAGVCAQLCAVICSLAVCATAITFAVYLGMFAMNNPNGDGWYGKVGDVEYMRLKKDWDLAPAGLVSDLDHVHDHFVTWFMWGFINQVTILGAAMLICIPCCPPILGCAQCSVFAWWIAGMVWRLRQSGAFASGDVIQGNAIEEQWID